MSLLNPIAATRTQAITRPRNVIERAVSSERFDALWHAARNLLAIPSLVCIFLLLLSLRVNGLGLVYVLSMLILFAAVYLYMPRCDYRLFVLYLAGFAIFNGLRTTIHQLGVPVSYAYPIDVDGKAFGELPTLWLQDHFFTLGKYAPYDWIAVGVYTSYFSAHFLLGGLIWFIKRDFLGSYIKLILAVFFAGLVGYLLIPTSPPWLAAETGHLPEVFRISKLLTSQVWADAYSQSTYVAGTNDVAAMPSLHTALTAAVAITLWRLNRLAGLFGWLYVAAMGLSLVYLGEHYVTDVVAGIVLACAIARLLRFDREAPRQAGLARTRIQ